MYFLALFGVNPVSFTEIRTLFGMALLQMHDLVLRQLEACADSLPVTPRVGGQGSLQTYSCPERVHVSRATWVKHADAFYLSFRGFTGGSLAQLSLLNFGVAASLLSFDSFGKPVWGRSEVWGLGWSPQACTHRAGCLESLCPVALDPCHSVCEVPDCCVC